MKLKKVFGIILCLPIGIVIVALACALINEIYKDDFRVLIAVGVIAAGIYGVYLLTE